MRETITAVFAKAEAELRQLEELLRRTGDRGLALRNQLSRATGMMTTAAIQLNKKNRTLADRRIVRAISHADEMAEACRPVASLIANWSTDLEAIRLMTAIDRLLEKSDLIAQECGSITASDSARA